MWPLDFKIENELNKEEMTDLTQLGLNKYNLLLNLVCKIKVGLHLRKQFWTFSFSPWSFIYIMKP